MGNGLFNNDMVHLTLKGLDAVSLRQKTIAHNMANINTPGFKRSEVRFEEKLEKILETRGKERLSASDYRMIEPEVVKVEGTTQRQDGNNVNMEIELSQMAVNLILYQSLIQQLNDRLGNLRYVINDGRR